MNTFPTRRVPHDLATVAWAGEDDVVVFDETSGETARLNVVEQAALACFPSNEERAGFDDWAERVARELDVALDAQLREYLKVLVQQFADVGLVM